MLYVFRAIAYEIPYFGGRARGGRRPQAPSLAERPNGRARTFSIAGPLSGIDGEERVSIRRRPSDTGGRADSGAIAEEDESAKNR